MKEFRANKQSERAFTRVELVCLLSIFTALASLVAPSFGRSQSGVRALECLANKHELMRAWAAFAADNDGLLPGNVHGSSTQTPPPSNPPWVLGFMTWDGSFENTNTIRLTNRAHSCLAPYLRGATAPFLCPADTYVSLQQRSLGWQRRIRSVSANILVGPGNAESGPYDTAYFTHANRVSDFVNPAPSDTFVFLDEHPDSMNDGAFFPPISTTQVIDLPASYHDRAAGFSFADGRAELHSWSGPLIAAPVRFSNAISTSPVSPSDRNDVLWLRARVPHR